MDGLLWQRMAHRRPMVLGLAAALGLVAVQPAWALSPTAVLEAFFGRANSVLHSVDLAGGLEESRQAIRALVNEVFDFQEAAALALGPVWRSRTPEQQREFVQLFAEYLERGYVAMMSSKASVTSGVTVHYLGESVAGESAMVTTTLLTRSGKELPVDYSMVRRGDRWAVRDVVIDGVSLVANYRAQFNRILRSASYADLVARMRGDLPHAPQSNVAAMTPASKVGPTVPEAEPAARIQRVAGSTAPLPAPPAVHTLPGIRRELHLTVRPREETTLKDDRSFVEVQEPAIAQKAEPASKTRMASTYYWVQVGAFKTADAAVRLADRLRRQGVTALQNSLTSVTGQPADMLARVRVGPFVNRAQAMSALRELMARGYAPFIAEGRD